MFKFGLLETGFVGAVGVGLETGAVIGAVGVGAVIGVGLETGVVGVTVWATGFSVTSTR